MPRRLSVTGAKIGASTASKKRASGPSSEIDNLPPREYRHNRITRSYSNSRYGSLVRWNPSPLMWFSHAATADIAW